MSAAEALAPEQSVDEVRESLSVTEKGQPANTIGNCRTVFCHDPLLRGAIRLNLLTDRVDIVRDLGWRRNTSALTDTDVKYLLLYFEQNYGLTSEKKMTAALSIVANENCYHPIQDVLNGLVWDGTSRIRSCLHHFLGADESDYVEEMLKHFLLGAIRRVFSPGSKYEEMLCLVGGQGAGKSSFFRLLAIRDEWFSDDLKKLDDDRVYLKLQGHWIIEMSEMLATSSAKSIEEIRSFISRQKETYRTPYEAQRLLKDLFGADHAAGVVFQKSLYLPGLGVLRHEILLHLHQLALDRLAELHGVVAAAVDNHGLRPDLQQVGSGSVLVLQNVNLRILRVNHDWKETPVPGPVKGQEVQRVG